MRDVLARGEEDVELGDLDFEDESFGGAAAAGADESELMEAREQRDEARRQRDQARDELSRDPIIWWNLAAASAALDAFRGAGPTW